MSILIIGDPHYKQSNSRHTDIMERDILEIIKNNEIAFIVILGDTLDTHERIYVDCFMRVSKFLDKLIKTEKHVFLLIGNHDRPNNRVFLTDEHPFNLYKHVKGITVVDTCVVHELNSNIYCNNSELSATSDYNEDKESTKKLRFCFVPYVPDGMYMKALEVCGIDPQNISVFFSHSEFDGCKINKLTKKKCDKWPLNFPMNISGHIHNEELVQNNLFYTGTPFQHDFNDDPDKGVYLMDLKSGKFELDKVRLNVPSKIVMKVHFTQLETIQLDPRFDIRLEIIGPIEQVKTLMNRHDMLAKFAHVSKKYKDETKQSKNMPVITNNFQFYEKMLRGLENNEKLLNAFRGLFPNI
uniref:Calcineurin-like phosphoesterase domain-containing protein n=1 Tax=viral metagenome TaxID=1070528 RepID=A0A6C0BCE5_9ZZZZ